MTWKTWSGDELCQEKSKPVLIEIFPEMTAQRYLSESDTKGKKLFALTQPNPIEKRNLCCNGRNEAGGGAGEQPPS